MNIQTARFVGLSDVLDGYPAVRDAISEGDWPSITWGDANRTLISKERFESEILDIIPCDTGKMMAQMEKVEARLKELPQDVYIDMES